MKKSNRAIMKKLRAEIKYRRNNPKLHYAKYKAMLMDFVKKNWWKLEQDELWSVANEAYAKARVTYDPTKAQFSTHLYYTLLGAFTRIKVKREEPLLNEFKLHNPDKNPLEEALFNEKLDSLSNEAREVIETILNTPSELIEIAKETTCNNYKITMNTLKKYLLRIKGWKHIQIITVFTEIREKL